MVRCKECYIVNITFLRLQNVTSNEGMAKVLKHNQNKFKTKKNMTNPPLLTLD